MGLPQLNSCCCGCSLSTGTKIIGWLGLIGAVLIGISMWGSLTILKTIEEHPENPDFKPLQAYIPILRTFFWAMMVFGFFHLVNNIILLKGVYEKKPGNLKIWIVASLVLTALLYLLKLIVMFIFTGFVNPFEFLSILLQLYFVLVVYSLYREMLQDPAAC